MTEAVEFPLHVVGFDVRYRSDYSFARIVLGIPTCH
jgi:hypothetical protein